MDHSERYCQLKKKQARTGPSLRPIQGSKIAKRLSSVKYSILQYSKVENFTKIFFSKKLHTQKNGPSGTPGPASASPWRAERGTLPKFQRKKISQCRKKSERGDPLGFSNIHSVAKQQKN